MSEVLSPQRIFDLVSETDWNFSDAETDYLTHNIHRYSGKFIPQIASKAISILTFPGDKVLDPYCGSGTLILEAALQSRDAIGIDLNPLAVLITKAKITTVTDDEADKLQKSFYNLPELVSSKGDLFASKVSKIITTDPRLGDAWFTKWFDADVLLELVILSGQIAKLKNERLKVLGTVAFSDILRRVSKAHQGYPNVMFDRHAKLRPRPYPLFLKSLKRVLAAAIELRTKAANLDNCMIYEGDARSLPLKDASVDAVITHPPYIGSIPYAEYGLLSLKWLGVDPKKLDEKLTGGRRQSRDVLSRFIQGYQAMFLEAARVLKPRKYMFLMVGNPIVRGSLVDLAEISIECSRVAGFKQISTATRTGANRRANKMGSETLLFFQRP